MATASALAARTTLAHRRILAAVEQLADDPAQVEALKGSQLPSRDPAYQAVVQLESIVGVLEGLVADEAAPTEEVARLSPTPSPVVLPLDEPTVMLLVNAGFDTPEALREATDDELLAIKGIGRKTLKEIRGAPGLARGRVG